MSASRNVPTSAGIRRPANPRLPMECPFTEIGTSAFAASAMSTTLGAIYAIATQLRTAAWANPHTAGRVTVSDLSGAYPNADLVDRTYTGNAGSTGNTANSWIKVDLKDRTLLPTRYAIQNRQIGAANHNIINWVFEGSVDNSTWEVLHTGSATPSGWVAGTIATFAVTPTQTAYRYFRIRQTGVNTDGANFLCLGEIELFGTLY